MLVAAIGERNHECCANSSRPEHEEPGDREPDRTDLRQEEWHCRKDHQRQQAVANHARTRVQVQVTVPSGEHVEHHVEEDGADDDPAKDNSELDLTGE